MLGVLRESFKQNVLNVGTAKVVDGCRGQKRGFRPFDAAAVDEGEFEEKLIEGRPEVVDGVTDAEPEKQRKLATTARVQDQPSR